MPINFKASPAEFNQRLLFPDNIFDRLPEDHKCFLYADLFRQLDTTQLESQFSDIGQNAFHPKLLISILIYAYSHGVFSSRQIARRCNEDLAFMFIAQLNCPNFRVLSDFRKNNPLFFRDCFKQTVKLAMELGLASLGHISLDGTKFKASSSKYKAMSYKRLKEKKDELTREINTLLNQAKRCDTKENRKYKDKTGYEIPEDLKYKKQRLAKIVDAKAALEKREQAINPDTEIADKKQISFADKDSRIMGKKGDFDYRYNAQISVDKDNQIIVGQHLSQNANDKQEVEPALKSIQGTTGRLPDLMSVDNGYMSGNNLEAFESSSIDVYIATNKGEKKSKVSLHESGRKLVKADFVYDKLQDCFTCPGGQELMVRQKKKDGTRLYQGDSDICDTCVYKGQCCNSTKGAARTIRTDDKEPLRQQMNAKMEEERSKEIYKLRKTIVEPVNGQIKNSGFRGFSVRGKIKTAGEFSLVCAAHNFKKIIRALSQGVLCPVFGQLGKVCT